MKPVVIYNDEFYEAVTQDALRSARIIVPILLNVIRPASIIDVGCGQGAWLRAFQENGVVAIRGLEGSWVDRSKLLFDPRYFSPVDLRASITIDGKYDLAVCLEVAEHLPQKSSRDLVEALTSAAPFVLFSAAIPKQGGLDHVNEQWPWFWQSLFAEQGFQQLDPIRRHIWQDNRVDWWYRQNIFLYASEVEVAQSDVLRSEREMAEARKLECIHISILRQYIDCVRRYSTLRGALRELPRLIRRAVRLALASNHDE